MPGPSPAGGTSVEICGAESLGAREARVVEGNKAPSGGIPVGQVLRQQPAQPLRRQPPPLLRLWD